MFIRWPPGASEPLRLPGSPEVSESGSAGVSKSGSAGVWECRSPKTMNCNFAPSPHEFSELLNYYKDDLAIGGYDPNVS